MPPSLDPQPILDIANAFYQSQTLFTASDAGIFAHLAAHPEATADETAAALDLAPRGVRLLMDACVAIGLLMKDGDRYDNTPMAGFFLVPGSPGDLSRAIRYNRDVYPAWGRAGEFVRRGQPVEKPAIHLGDDAERTRAFVLSMHGRALGIGRAVVPMIDLAGCTSVLDVGGGPGTYSVLLAQANPGIRSTVLDLPGVVAVASELIAQQNMQERVTTLAGSYHETPFPPNQDAVLFFGMLHQESPEAICALFENAFAALRPGGRVFVMDMMTDATHTAPVFSALFALNMALTTENGWVFSDAELVGWLEGAGFEGVAIRPLAPPMPHWLATASKP